MGERGEWERMGCEGGKRGVGLGEGTENMP